MNSDQWSNSDDALLYLESLDSGNPLRIAARFLGDLIGAISDAELDFVLSGYGMASASSGITRASLDACADAGVESRILALSPSCVRVPVILECTKFEWIPEGAVEPERFIQLELRNGTWMITAVRLD